MTKHLRIAFLMALALVLALAGSALAADTNKPANAGLAFDKLKSLVGQWEATSNKGKVTASYELVANGTALLEKTKVENEGEMVTVYHLDGNRLVLTHYCIAGNQPHLQARAFDPASQEIRFDFLSATNLASPADGHIHSAVIKFVGPDSFNSDWTFNKDGKAAVVEQMQFHRVR
jgi:hypothetical protein